jgi:NitT/TauT family transport system substrate-binding protein
MIKIIFLFFTILWFSSCSTPYDNRLKISTTTWIGYAPLFYAKEMGWLDKLNIKLLKVSSLAENLYLYKAGNSDAFLATQYEYKVLKEQNLTLKPIIMLDKSNGGDLVLSNYSIKELQDTNKQIEAYLEIDSVNSILLADFISKYNLNNKKIIYINNEQTKTEFLKLTSKPTIIVTYIPYNLKLEKLGFKEIVSTKDNNDLLVCDAMFTKTEVFNEHKQQFIELKKYIDKAIDIIKKDPKSFYVKVQSYMQDMSYDDFVTTLDDIIWIHNHMDENLKKKLVKSNFPIRDLL